MRRAHFTLQRHDEAGALSSRALLGKTLTAQGAHGSGLMCRPDFVIDSTFDLFCELCATDEQCDFPVVYASGVNGIAGGSPEDLAEDLAPLFEAIVKEVGEHASVI